MPSNHNDLAASIELSSDQRVLRCRGAWTLTGLEELEPELMSYAKQVPEEITLDGEHIETMDSAGALLFQDLVDRIKSLGKSVTITGFNEATQSLLNLVAEQLKVLHKPLPTPTVPGFLYFLGEWAVIKWIVIINFLSFVGETVVTLGRCCAQPRRIQWRATLRTVDEGGYRALPIVALLTFLVGVVLTYQIALELESYNADIFIVDIAGMVILREFGPLITAIIAAGRTATAFTAQIGTMKVNEEIDALYTMGVPPIERLVLPKIFGVVVALTLLTVWADVFGVFGSMVMAKYQMGISYYSYLDRFQHAIAVRHYIVGLVKAPVFALIVAAVGCFQGFQVAATADDVGKKTTQSAVQSIFLIIIADAIFSIVFSWRGI